ncbi:MAG TPA: diguanylate cyclase [Candidatus Saccharimonadia bacterium]|nr:diguanylate cyclase [Candidatus Saccharimonadia bacterium]
MSERQLAVVVQIARIATEDLELRPMLERVVGAVRDAFGWEFVAYASLDKEGGRFVCDAVSSELPSEIHVGYVRPLGYGVVGRVLQTGEPLLIDDVATCQSYVATIVGTRSELCVPVRHRGELLGIINAESLRVGAFSGYLEVLQTVADQVAGAIAGGRLHQELTRRADLLELMSRISRTALQSDQLDEVLQSICAFVRERFDLDFCSILLSGSADALVAATSARDPAAEMEHGVVWSTTRGIVGRAFRSGEIQFVADVTRDPDYVMVNTAVAAELAIPVRHHDRMLGVMNIEAASVDALSPGNRQMLIALADQVAGAIHLATVNRKLGETLTLAADNSAQLAHANERLRIANEKLERLSTVDGLTGIANRRQFDSALRQEWRRARRRAHPIALLLVDIDHFKGYNDGYGHIAGDDCLRRVAATLERTLTRAGDIVARYGGEEFAVLLPETELDEAARTAALLHEAVRALRLPHRHAVGRDVVSVCVGCASVQPNPGIGPNDLVDRADKALYVAKLAGRDCIRTYVAT